MKKIYINEEDFDVSVAIAEENRLINFFVEKNVYAKTGNIYKGKVEKVVTNMNFVFVDIGDSKPAFLSEREYFDFSGTDYREMFGEGNGRPDEELEGLESREAFAGNFEKGQELIVQAIKEPYNTKGARLTTNIMLPGHSIVFCPFTKHTGISKRITDENERARLKKIIAEAAASAKEPFGVIARTQAKGVKEEDLKKEIEAQVKAWETIKENFKKSKAPALLYKEYDLPIKILREYFDDNVSEVVVDSEEIHRNVCAYLESKNKKIDVKLYEGLDPVLEYYGIAKQTEGIFNNIVPFKKGGYIKVDVTEALTVIDINSGKFKGVDDVESSLLLMNENAAREIARQIILRNIGGLIVVDFIDMQKEENRQKIKEIMEEELSKSKMYFKATKISEFGMMEITRKRDVKRAEDIFFEECPCCGGRGRVLTEENICINHLKKIKYECRKAVEKNVVIGVPANVKSRIYADFKDYIKGLEKKFKKKIVLKIMQESKE